MPSYVEPVEATTFEPDALVALCIENGAGALLLDEGRAPPAFFDLRTRLAGELLHGLSKYGLRLAAVVPDLAAREAVFRDFAREANRGEAFRFFATRAEALAWLDAS